MTTLLEEPAGSALPASGAPRRVRPRRWRTVITRWTIRRALVVVIGTAGLAVLLFPQAGAWFSDRAHSETISGYVQTVTSMEPAQTRTLLAAAHAYNRHLPRGVLQDPYSSSGSGRETVTGRDAETYLHTLDIGADGIIGVVAIPRVSVSLPIYHGTGPLALERGVGHLYGSALPVGGRGTHAVLTGHSGIAGVTLFSNLHDVRVDDTFTVTVLDQTLTYRVDQIRTVLPEQTKDLQAVPGQDFVTLVTCTPTGVNTHRLLVRGVRIPTPVTGGGPEFLHGNAGPGFEWWMLEAPGGLLLLLLLTAPLGRPPRHRPRQAA